MSLQQLTKQHTRTMILLNEAEAWETSYFLGINYFQELSYNPVALDELRDTADDLIAVAAELTGQIHDLKTADEAEQHFQWWLDNHDCGNSPMDGCTCNLYREEARA